MRMINKIRTLMLVVAGFVGSLLSLGAYSSPLFPSFCVIQSQSVVTPDITTRDINAGDFLDRPDVLDILGAFATLQRAEGRTKLSALQNFQLIQFAYSNAFVFSPRRLRWTAYDGRGRAIKSGRASGGKGYCADVRRSCRTPVGHFRVRSKGGPGCKSSKYPLGKGGAPMPYCTFFRGNYAIHGTNDLPNYNASHGCIRVSPASARWLSRNFLRHGTRVIVLSY